MAETQNLQLGIYDANTDGKIKYIDYFTSTNSNMTKIDNAYGKLQQDIQNIDVSEQVEVHNTSDMSHEDIRNLMGQLSSLTTEEKINLVVAINEVKSQSNDIATVELPKKANKIQENYIKATLLNGWEESYGIGVQYAKNDLGYVTLKINLETSASTNLTNLTPVCILPVGYRPLTPLPTLLIDLSSGRTRGESFYFNTDGKMLVQDGIAPFTANKSYAANLTYFGG